MAHRIIGRAARRGAPSGIRHEVPAGTDWIGYPARPAEPHFGDMALPAYLGEQGAVWRSLIRPAGAHELSKP